MAHVPVLSASVPLHTENPAVAVDWALQNELTVRGSAAPNETDPAAAAVVMNVGELVLITMEPLAVPVVALLPTAAAQLRVELGPRDKVTMEEINQGMAHRTTPLLAAVEPVRLGKMHKVPLLPVTEAMD